MHQLHHSAARRHRDRNMGFALSIWDQLFGTAYLPAEREHLRLGLGEDANGVDQDDGRWHRLSALYFRPFVGLFRLLSRR